MAWFSVEDTAPDHPKVKRLARLSGREPFDAFGRLVALWCWVIRFAPDGDLSDLDREDIEDVSGLSVEHLVACRLLDAADNKLIVHDWLSRRSNYREATGRAARRKIDGLRESDPGQSADSPRTSSGHDADHPAERRGEERKREESMRLRARENESETNLPALERAVADAGIAIQLSRSDRERWSKLHPVESYELDHAIAQAKAKIGVKRPGYVLSIIEGERQRAAELPNQPGARAPPRGWRPVSGFNPDDYRDDPVEVSDAGAGGE